MFLEQYFGSRKDTSQGTQYELKPPLTWDQVWEVAKNIADGANELYFQVYREQPGRGSAARSENSYDGGLQVVFTISGDRTQIRIREGDVMFHKMHKPLIPSPFDPMAEKILSIIQNAEVPNR